MAVDSYSRVVQYLKVLLPLTALGLLSAVFLLSSRGTDTVAPIPFAEDEIADRTRGQQITGPFFSAVTPKGEQIQVQATLARPGGENAPAEATDMIAELLLLGGKRIRLTSDLGTVQLDKDLAIFTGNVVITTSDGLTVTTDQLNTGLSGISGETPGSVHGTGPIGEFTAGSMQMGAENEDSPIHIRFKNGVKLLYDPKAAER